ncbi:MAG: hypothetical protein IT203_12470 [Fimbriimonadaceae bacterium]|nr:hypothetical protein [Fimbriimonadaceae bacterium]
MLRKFREILSHDLVNLHYCESDVDQNRTVTAFSGEDDVVVDMVLRLAMACFDSIDLNKHVGVHPRIGALDVCPFVILHPVDQTGAAHLMNALAVAEDAANMLATTFDLPVFLYERSERGRHEADLPSLRRGGFGGLLERDLKPDFGPKFPHPRLGVTVLGVRDFLLAFNVNLETDEFELAKGLERAIRQLRLEGDPRFLGVRALGLSLPSRGLTQISLNLTLPDVTAPDPIIEWITEQAHSQSIQIEGVELVGAIRAADLPLAARIPVRRAQIIPS